VLFSLVLNATLIFCLKRYCFIFFCFRCKSNKKKPKIAAN
jgi:hypothetical protein